MGKVRVMIEGILVVAIWGMVTSFTGCSQDQILTSCNSAAKVLEVCEIEIPR